MIRRPIISAILILLPIVIVTVIEYTSRKFRVSPEITRKLVHITLGIVATLGFIEGPIWLYVFIVSILALFIAISFRKKLLSSINGVKRPTYGEVFLPIGILAPLVLVSHTPYIYVASILILTLADSGAGLTVYLLNKNKKTIAGSLVFFAIASVVIILCTNSPLLMAMGVALGVTVVERFSPFGSDNLTVPLAATALMLLFKI
ncbi:MAG: hypothetical protein WCK26_00260 [Candidatus Saccharibacteria bacterium]